MQLSQELMRYDDIQTHIDKEAASRRHAKTNISLAACRDARQNTATDWQRSTHHCKGDL